MTIELTCLVANTLWGFLLVMIEILGKTRLAGPAWNAGNRDQEQSFPPWIQRTGRALDNHKENFPLFLTAVLVCTLSHHTDRITAAAAIAYVVLRALHGVIYIAGVKGLRSLSYLGGIACVFVLFSRLLA